MSKFYNDKRAFYRQPEVVSRYDAQRFGGASGMRVNQRELGLIDGLLPAPAKLGGPVLDLGCGTGRLSVHLSQRGYDVTAMDSSPAMLEETRKQADVRTILGDAFAIPVDEPRFGAVVMLRLAFHYPELDKLLQEAARVTLPNGFLIFDTYRWSPRALLPLGKNSWGGKVTLQGPEVVAEAAQRTGLKIVESRACFLVSPYVYRLLPYTLSTGLERFEAHVPERLLIRIFWKLAKM